MKIYDTNKNLIAVFKKYKDIKNSKNFLTDNKDEFQFGTLFEKGDEIKRHIPMNNHEIFTALLKQLLYWMVA